MDKQRSAMIRFFGAIYMLLALFMLSDIIRIGLRTYISITETNMDFRGIGGVAFWIFWFVAFLAIAVELIIFIILLVISTGLFRLSEKMMRFAVYFNIIALIVIAVSAAGGICSQLQQSQNPDLAEFVTKLAPLSPLFRAPAEKAIAKIFEILALVLFLWSTYYFHRPDVKEQFWGTSRSVIVKTPMRFAFILLFVCLLGLVISPAFTDQRKKEDGHIKKYASKLESGDVQVRIHTIRKMGRSRDPRVITMLIEALDDADPTVQEAAVYALRNFNDKRIMVQLIAILKEQQRQDTVRRGAAEQLGRYSDPAAIDSLLQLFDTKNTTVAEGIVRALSKNADPRITSHLITALENQDPEIIRRAMNILQEKKKADITADLIKCLEHENYHTRLAAVTILAARKDASAFKSLISAVSDEHHMVRTGAVSGLGKFRNREAVPTLRGALQDSHHEVRAAAAYSLGAIKDPEAVAELIKTVKDNNRNVRLQAVFALGQIGDEAGIEGLTVALGDNDKSVRKSALRALKRIGSPEALKIIDREAGQQDITLPEAVRR